MASSDRGPDGVVIIWDTRNVQLIRTIYKPSKNGVESIAFTYDACYLAILSADKSNQTFSIWNWSNGCEEPVCIINLNNEYSYQLSISFKLEDYHYVVTNGKHQIIFYCWVYFVILFTFFIKDNNGDIQMFSPTLTDKDFKQKVGTFSYTVFVPKKDVAVTGTSCGLLAVWENKNFYKSK